ncbi:MAG: TRAP transporter small permease [Alcaligenaceae bacterium]|nr:TRAP transporter small permease [Alcaligenaceae bacterium]
MTNTRQSGPWAFLNHLLSPLEAAAVIAAAAMLLAAMVLVSADALLRYAFNAPLSFQYTLTENYLLVGLICLALPWGYRTGGYIRIQALAARLAPGWRVWLLRIGILLSAIYMAILGWLGATYFWEAWINQEYQLGVIDWPVSWSWAPIPIGCGLLALRLALQSFGPVDQLHIDHADDGAVA